MYRIYLKSFSSQNTLLDRDVCQKPRGTNSATQEVNMKYAFFNRASARKSLAVTFPLEIFGPPPLPAIFLVTISRQHKR